MSCVPLSQMRLSARSAPLEVGSSWALMTRQLIWMNAKNLMSVNMGSASTRTAPIAASVPLVIFWKGMSVWIPMNAPWAILVETGPARM